MILFFFFQFTFIEENKREREKKLIKICKITALHCSLSHPKNPKKEEEDNFYDPNCKIF